MRHRINIVAKADTRAVVAPKCRITVMTNACREFQRRKDVPLILQIEGAIDERTIIDAHSTTVLDCRIILCELETRRQQMITELLVKLVAKSPRPITEIIKGACRVKFTMSKYVIIIFTARNTHLILGCVIDLHIPYQVSIEMIIVSTIDI